MNLRYSKRFLASFRKLAKSDKTATLYALETFQEEPLHASLHNHALTGKMTGKRAIAVDHDLRIVFAERNDYQDVTLLDIGSHAEVYQH